MILIFTKSHFMFFGLPTVSETAVCFLERGAYYIHTVFCKPLTTFVIDIDRLLSQKISLDHLRVDLIFMQHSHCRHLDQSTNI
jgi:hypothetical protein